ncbi:MAG TPA: peroxidase family protein [Prosthecobacter sp.]|nr:peroxidase family protein [Prosthecobacter sp.]HRK15922.1 peroxidase family protein [Prosthecobacter sp.]
MKTNIHPFGKTILLAAAVFALGIHTATAQTRQLRPPPPRPSANSTPAAPIPRADPGRPEPPRPPQTPPPRQNPPPPKTRQPLPPALPESFVMPEQFRSHDGRSNHATDTERGAAGRIFIRLAPGDYADGAGEPAGAQRPSPRAISNAVSAQPAPRVNGRGASDMLWQWGQFLDHDLDETPAASPSEPFAIQVPAGDPQFDPAATGAATIGLNRSAYEVVNGKREQKNAITPWIDASQVYGSDEARALALRSNDGSGRLKTSSSAHGDLLPTHSDELAALPPVPGFFVAGDVRVNEQVGLIAIHTLFVREHNFWADLYRTANPDAGEEEIYQFARLIVGSEVQAITYREFLPIILGPGALRPYRGYNPDTDPAISNEFATAAYRLGHSLLSPALLRLDAWKKEIAAGHLSLAGAFFQPGHVTSEGVDVVLRGLCLQRCQELDAWIIEDVRNFLFGAPGAGGLDLASLNLQRGRDHGLPAFAAMRDAFGMRPVKTFKDISPFGATAAQLASVYAQPGDVDLWIGGLAEAKKPGAMVGPVFHRILADQFTRLRDADRFWYQNIFSKEMIRMIERQTLSVILRRNTGLGREIPDKAFLAPPPPARSAAPRR